MRKNLAFILTAIISVLLILLGIIFPKELGEYAGIAQSYVGENFGWFYIIIIPFFLIFSLFLAFSKYGNIKLGKNTDQPEFSRLSWITMLYSSGFAIGLFFWGVAQPILGYTSPPVGDGYTMESAKFGMRYSFLIWGILNWGFYTIGGLVMGYFIFRRGTPPLVNYAFYPLIGDKIHGFIGKIIIVITIIATLFGLITSLGQGALQLGAGLDIAWGIPNTEITQVFIIIILSIIFTVSTVLGINRGIRNLSNLNIFLAVGVLIYIFLAGPTAQILNIFVGTLGDHVSNFISDALFMGPFSGEDTSAWMQDWTLFFWGWGISFAAFVGFFIARISKGRTIREYVIGAIIIPTIGTFIWFSVIGGTALHYVHNLGITELADSVINDKTAALFDFLEFMPFAPQLMSVVIISIIIFFVTSGDSNVYVLGMFTESKTNPSAKIKTFWAIIIAGATIAVLLSGGLDAIQAVVTVVGLPFAVVLLLMCVSFFKALREEEFSPDNNQNN